MIDLFNHTVDPWQPFALPDDHWPPNYVGAYQWRLERLADFKKRPELIGAARAYYTSRPGDFIMHWIDTFDPRKKENKWVPFVFFKRQEELVNFIQSCMVDNSGGLIEKCRDAGATWIACAWSVWAFLFVKNVAIGWGSRKEALVDRLGDTDSIFEKMRLILGRLPAVFIPDGFVLNDHANFMKIINPENGATITGEAGDNIGRGGRKSIYFKDESAHYERPDKIEAALGDNTNVQIDISSVNGLGNVFHRRREAGVEWPRIEPNKTRVFVFDWRDHPEKTIEWYNARKQKAENDGLSHIFAQEIDRDYSGAALNTIIPIEWIRSAVDAHLKIPEMLDGLYGAALDVADEGNDRNASATIKGVVLIDCQEWGSRDVGVSARKAIDACAQYPGIKMQYDCIGIGAAVKSEFNRLVDDRVIDVKKISLIAWSAAAAVQNPHDRVVFDDENSQKNKDFFGNLKAQAWWALRERFRKTHQFINDGVKYDIAEMISLDKSLNLLRQIEKELAQPTRGQNGQMKMIVNKKPDGTKSPNLADAIVMVFYPLLEPDHFPITGVVSNG